MKRVYDFLKKAEIYYLATVEGDQPRVRPFGTILIFRRRKLFLKRRAVFAVIAGMTYAALPAAAKRPVRRNCRKIPVGDWFSGAPELYYIMSGIADVKIAGQECLPRRAGGKFRT